MMRAEKPLKPQKTQSSERSVEVKAEKKASWALRK